MPHLEMMAKGIKWHHFAGVGEEDFEYLQTNFKFHPLDYEDIRSGSPISKLDPYRHYVFCVFHIPVISSGKKQIQGRPLYVFLGKETLVTITGEPIDVVDGFVEKISRNSKLRAGIMGKGTGFVLYRLLLGAFRDALPIASRLTNEVAALEDRVEDMHDKRTTVDLGRARRNVLSLRHIIDPQRRMLVSLSGTKRPFLDEEMSVYFDDLQDVMDTLWLSADNLKLIIDGLFDINESLLSHKTNEVVTALTFISAALMAPALVVGFYGMNVDWLPLVDNAWFVVSVLLMAFVIIGLVVIWLTRMRSNGRS